MKQVIVVLALISFASALTWQNDSCGTSACAFQATSVSWSTTTPFTFVISGTSAQPTIAGGNCFQDIKMKLFAGYTTVKTRTDPTCSYGICDANGNVVTNQAFAMTMKETPQNGQFQAISTFSNGSGNYAKVTIFFTCSTTGGVLSCV